MGKTELQVRTKLRTDSLTNWTDNSPFNNRASSSRLLSGEPVVVIDDSSLNPTHGRIRLKIGDGSSVFSDLKYIDELLWENVDKLISFESSANSRITVTENLLGIKQNTIDTTTSTVVYKKDLSNLVNNLSTVTYKSNIVQALFKSMMTDIALSDSQLRPFLDYMTTNLVSQEYLDNMGIYSLSHLYDYLAKRDLSNVTTNVFRNGQIRDSVISFSNIEWSSFQNGWILDSYIANSTLSGAKIIDATIGLEKVSMSFITDLFADNITTNTLNSKYLEVDAANLTDATIHKLFVETGLVTNATVENAHITGVLDSVEINASSITGGTIMADRLFLTDKETGTYKLFDGSDEPVLGKLDGLVIAERTLTPDRIVTKSITTNELNSTQILSDRAFIKELFANDIVATGSITSPILVSPNYTADYDTNTSKTFTQSPILGATSYKSFSIEYATINIFDKDFSGTDDTNINSKVIPDAWFGTTSTTASTKIESKTGSYVLVAKYIPKTGDIQNGLFTKHFLFYNLLLSKVDNNKNVTWSMAYTTSFPEGDFTIRDVKSESTTDRGANSNYWKYSVSMNMSDVITPVYLLLCIDLNQPVYNSDGSVITDISTMCDFTQITPCLNGEQVVVLDRVCPYNPTLTVSNKNLCVEQFVDGGYGLALNEDYVIDIPFSRSTKQLVMSFATDIETGYDDIIVQYSIDGITYNDIKFEIDPSSIKYAYNSPTFIDGRMWCKLTVEHGTQQIHIRVVKLPTPTDTTKSFTSPYPYTFIREVQIECVLDDTSSNIASTDYVRHDSNTITLTQDTSFPLSIDGYVNGTNIITLSDYSCEVIIENPSEYHYSKTGTKIDLAHNMIHSEHFAMIDGNFYTTQGLIGGWKITDNKIYTEQSVKTDDGKNLTTVLELNSSPAMTPTSDTLGNYAIAVAVRDNDDNTSPTDTDVVFGVTYNGKIVLNPSAYSTYVDNELNELRSQIFMEGTEGYSTKINGNEIATGTIQADSINFNKGFIEKLFANKAVIKALSAVDLQSPILYSTDFDRGMYKALTTEPSDWSASYTNYYEAQKSDEGLATVYVKLNGSSAPTFVANNYYSRISNDDLPTYTKSGTIIDLASGNAELSGETGTAIISESFSVLNGIFTGNQLRLLDKTDSSNATKVVSYGSITIGKFVFTTRENGNLSISLA